MEDADRTSRLLTTDEAERRFPAVESPFVRPGGRRTVFLVTLAAACGPLLAGIVLFGWRAVVVTALAVGGCAFVERLYYRVTRVPALLGRSHAYLTGLLLALTLPAFVPWYVPLIAAAFAIIVGKAVFGGVGHFLWQPALVGLLAVTFMFPETMDPGYWPVLTPQHVLTGDVRNHGHVADYEGWRGDQVPPDGIDAFRLERPVKILSGLTKTPEPQFSCLHLPRQKIERAKPAALLALPPISDLIYGGYPGGIGETCSVVIILAGLYLIYRNYLKWQLPFSFLAAAWCVAAVAPVQLAAPHGTTEVMWWPLLAEGAEAGFTYVNYQIFSGSLLLAAFLLAGEMTSRPVTTGGQVIFGLGCGAGAMLLRLYVDVPIPCYMAVLGMNTLTPVIDALWRPRVFGMPLLWRLRRSPR